MNKNPQLELPFLPEGRIVAFMQISRLVNKDLQHHPPQLEPPILKLASHGDLHPQFIHLSLLIHANSDSLISFPSN